MINSSADQPIGYPIYVSPLTTSFAETHPQLRRVIGPPVTFATIRQMLWRAGQRIRQSWGVSCSSNISLPPGGGTCGGGGGSLGLQEDCSVPAPVPMVSMQAGSSRTAPQLLGGIGGRSVDCTPPPRVQRSFTHPMRREAAPQSSRGSMQESRIMSGIPPSGRNSIVSTSASGKGTPRVSLSGVSMEPAPSHAQVRITSTDGIFDTLNLVRNHGRTLVLWPNEIAKSKGGRNAWAESNWEPTVGMIGEVVHRW